MLEDYDRAARMPNEPNVTWHRFVQSRFVQRSDLRRGAPVLTLDIQAVMQASGSHAEFSGLLEYAVGGSLPVVREVEGALDLTTRELLIDDPQGEDPERSLVGRFSENGRVLTVRSRAPGKASAKPVHLVHEETLRELLGG